MIFIGDIMKKAKIKAKVTILVCICIVIFIGALIADRYLGKSYLVEIKYDKLIEKIENKEDFVLLISQTTCTHCMDYKPKLKEVANKYKLEVYYIEYDLLKDKEKKVVKEHFNFEGTPQTVFVIGGIEKTAAMRIDGDASVEKIIKKFKSNGFIN